MVGYIGGVRSVAEQMGQASKACGRSSNTSLYPQLFFLVLQLHGRDEAAFFDSAFRHNQLDKDEHKFRSQKQKKQPEKSDVN